MLASFTEFNETFSLIFKHSESHHDLRISMDEERLVVWAADVLLTPDDVDKAELGLESLSLPLT